MARATHSSASRFARYAWGVLVFNLLVVLWGAFVRATGSGAGCGSHWPLCNGEVVPRSPAAATLIELAHRATSGVALVLVAGLVIGAWRSFPRRHPVRVGAGLSGLFLLTEALVGAGLVLLEHVASDASPARGFWVAGHLLNTFTLIACLALTAWWASGHPAPHFRGWGRLAMGATSALIGMLVLGMSGAVTALGDTLFPAASLAEAKAQTFSETAHIFVRLRIWHPTLAIAMGLGVLLVSTHVLATRPQRVVRNLAIALMGLYAGQLIVGVVNVWWLAPVGVQLLHLLLSDLVWITLVLLSATALTEREGGLRGPWRGSLRRAGPERAVAERR